jgi:hypothetical protein
MRSASRPSADGERAFFGFILRGLSDILLFFFCIPGKFLPVLTMSLIQPETKNKSFQFVTDLAAAKSQAEPQTLFLLERKEIDCG